VHHTRKWVLAAVSLAISVAVWWPFDFSLSAVSTAPSRTAGIALPHLYETREALANILLFLPFGLTASRASFESVVRATAYSAVLSLVLEVGQVFQAARILSVVDVVLNTLGALVGALLVAYAPLLLSRIAQEKASPFFAGTIAVVLITAVTAWMQDQFAAVDGWQEDHSLQIGNEATGNRPWCGEVHSFAFTTGGHSWTWDSFEFVKRETTEHPLPAGCTRHEWFQSATAPTTMIQAVRETGEVHLAVTAATQLSEQQGPARVISISRTPDDRNITLGQEGDDLIVRVRRRWGGTNGERPFYRIKDVFRAGEEVSITLNVGDDTTVLTVEDRTLIHRHNVVSQWWISLLYAYEWHDTAVSVPMSLIFWIALWGPFGAAIGAAAAGREWTGRRTATANGISAVVCWSILRALTVTLGWGSLVVMPVAAVASGELGRRACQTAQ